MSNEQLIEQVADAYEHIYDLAYLRMHPLTALLCPNQEGQAKNNAWQTHHILLNMIEELNPGPQAPVLSREWRRHRLMLLHYADGLDPQAVADRLGISRRHYYREHQSAVQAIVAILSARYLSKPHSATLATTGPDQLDLLRSEAARIARADHHAHLDEILAGLVTLLQDVALQREIVLVTEQNEPVPAISTDRTLLRQMLMTALSYLIERSRCATLRIGAQVEAGVVCVSLRVEPITAVRPGTGNAAADAWTILQTLAPLGAAEIEPVDAGFDIRLPTNLGHTVLVVDDNQDILQLFRRYLNLHHYRAVTAHTVHEALDLARRLQPYAITLDLMMPDQDGWDLLQLLLNQPDTRHIPVIVCSVLKHKDLALSLGAVAYLEKPISEQVLLAALEALS